MTTDLKTNYDTEKNNSDVEKIKNRLKQNFEVYDLRLWFGARVNALRASSSIRNRNNFGSRFFNSQVFPTSLYQPLCYHT